MQYKKLQQLAGALGVAACLFVFFKAPNWPTPDKIILFLTFVFMLFKQALAMLKRLGPFVLLLLVYESFRGIVPKINHNVSYDLLPAIDRWMFGGTLPSITLQNWLWHGHVRWFDFMLYGAYMLHFVLPLALAILIWKKRPKRYWRFVSTYLVVSFSGFLTFLFFPAAPPWMASDMKLIPHVEHVSSHVWYAMGIKDVSIIYNKFSPNPVAALPSLHAAYATLFALFIWKLFGRKWGLAACIYPVFIYFGTTYMGEHYFIDEIVGAGYGVGAYALANFLHDRYGARLKKKTSRNLHL